VCISSHILEIREAERIRDAQDVMNYARRSEAIDTVFREWNLATGLSHILLSTLVRSRGEEKRGRV
jgi:hypothetical protein